MRNDSFFTNARFPSLRALGIKTLACTTASGHIVRMVSTVVSPVFFPHSLASRQTKSNLEASRISRLPLLFLIPYASTSTLVTHRYLGVDPLSFRTLPSLTLTFESVSLANRFLTDDKSKLLSSLSKPHLTGRPSWKSCTSICILEMEGEVTSRMRSCKRGSEN